ncbi:hypothetical protein NDU88_000816 [Pleurodeles waltl]|uniref:Uncharacterized protein n=1 Tax=Pleurodeles waltl TaxID=8319 RepID=A0AAV7Q477_PLEWA|nr:hypothetical protein NDU88_000816 [Pleurodeles waltl]
MPSGWIPGTQLLTISANLQRAQGPPRPRGRLEHPSSVTLMALSTRAPRPRFMSQLMSVRSPWELLGGSRVSLSLRQSALAERTASDLLADPGVMGTRAVTVLGWCPCFSRACRAGSYTPPQDSSPVFRPVAATPQIDLDRSHPLSASSRPAQTRPCLRPHNSVGPSRPAVGAHMFIFLA